jgi:uncharacterized membrane protein
MIRTRIGDMMWLLVIAGLVAIPVILTSNGNNIILALTLAFIGTLVTLELIFIGVQIWNRTRRDVL